MYDKEDQQDLQLANLSLRTVGYYFHGDDFESYTPKLLSRVAQAVLDEETPQEPAPPAP